MIPNSFYKASITLTTKPQSDTSKNKTNKITEKRKESNILISQMKIEAKILNKLFANIIQ
jgi:hypothetical protein